MKASTDASLRLTDPQLTDPGAHGPTEAAGSPSPRSLRREPAQLTTSPSVLHADHPTGDRRPARLRPRCSPAGLRPIWPRAMYTWRRDDKSDGHDSRRPRAGILRPGRDDTRSGSRRRSPILLRGDQSPIVRPLEMRQVSVSRAGAWLSSSPAADATMPGMTCDIRACWPIVYRDGSLSQAA